MKELKTLIVNGNEYTVTDPNAARIDDALVGQATWSGRNIVDRLCPAFTESGAVAVCSPVAGYPLEVVSHIQPVQADSGYTQIKLTRCGKNLFDVEAGYGYISGASNGLVATKTATGYEITGTVSGGAFILHKIGTLADLGGKRITLSADTSSKPNSFYFVVCASDFSSRKAIYGTNISTGVCAATMPQASEYPDGYIVAVRFGCHDSDSEAVLTYENVQVEIGNTRTAYEPFIGMDTFTIDLGQTVYGGNFNWQTGVLTTPDGSTQQLEAREILALTGTNHLYSSTGDTVISGRADPTAVIEKLTNAIIALGGNI